MDTKEKIITKSLKLFEQYGYENVSIAKIMKECKISKGGLYHHFKNKEDILDKSIEYLIDVDYKAKKDLIFKDKNCIDRIVNVILIELDSNLHTKNLDYVRKENELYSTENYIFAYRAKKLSLKASIKIFEDIILEGISKNEVSTKEPLMAATYVFTISYEYLKNIHIHDKHLIYKTKLFIDLLSLILNTDKENFNKLYDFIKEKMQW